MTDLDGFDVGIEVPFHAARDPVNLPALRRWCDAMGYAGPLRGDLVTREWSPGSAIVGPLAMLDVWTKPGLAYQRDVANPQGAAFEALDEQGFTSSVAVRSELAQSRALRLGEQITSTIVLEAVSPQKRTGLGDGRFVTTRQDFFVNVDPVGQARTTVLKFRPPEVKSAAGPQSRAPERGVDSPAETTTPDPRRDEWGTVQAGQLRRGDSIPTLLLPVTATLIIAGALATSDFFEGHHDRDAAQRRGLPDIFMNIHTTLGLVEGYVGSWVGPNVTYESMSVRLGAPNHPGDQLTFAGTVVAADGDGRAKIAARAMNRLGLHADAEIDLRLPL